MSNFSYKLFLRSFDEITLKKLEKHYQNLEKTLVISLLQKCISNK